MNSDRRFDIRKEVKHRISELHSALASVYAFTCARIRCTIISVGKFSSACHITSSSFHLFASLQKFLKDGTTVLLYISISIHNFYEIVTVGRVKICSWILSQTFIDRIGVFDEKNGVICPHDGLQWRRDLKSFEPTATILVLISVDSEKMFSKNVLMCVGMNWNVLGDPTAPFLNRDWSFTELSSRGRKLQMKKCERWAYMGADHSHFLSSYFQSNSAIDPFG